MSGSPSSQPNARPTPLPAVEVLKHPGFKSTEWNLKPTQNGKLSVAKGRSGGPFNLWYEIHGTGDTKLVWIMGLGSFRTTWKRQTKYFGHTKSTQYSSLVFDNRGMGRSDKPSSRYTTTEMAQDTIELLTQLKWLNSTSPQRTLNIIGVSMGGMIAQELALLIPQHIQSLILVSTAPRLVRTVPFIENLRQRITMFIPRNIDVQLDETAHRLFASDFLASPDTDNPDPALNYPTKRDRFAAGELQKRMDTEGFTRKGFILQAIAAGWHVKSPAQIKEIGDQVGRQRICIMHGTADRMITFAHYTLFEKEFGEGVDGKAFEGKGHALLWEAEEEFNRAIEEFVGQAAKVT